MKTLLVALLCIFSFVQNGFSQGGLSPYYQLEYVQGSSQEISKRIKDNLQKNNFQLLGSYNPARNKNSEVIAFTHPNLTEICLKVADRGILASILRISITSDSTGNIEVVLLNPEYLFYGYLRDGIDPYELELNELSNMVKIAIRSVGGILLPFGSTSWTENELKQFRILVNYPSFGEPVEIAHYDSFEGQVQNIQKNLQARQSGTLKVYERIFADKKIAVFGVGFNDINKGEAKFLDQLGEKAHKNMAAFPYELVLQDNKVTILNGKFWFPFYWSNLSMKELKNIRHLPADVEYIMQGLTK